METAQSTTQPPSHPFRPLNVKDALSYLDRVKVTFNDQAEVYDRFLGIMKDFKSQGIDTPGVIERVSTLFRGHPALIQGFNTFLPPGYRIECSVSTPQDEEPVTTITVTTPQGMTTHTQVTANAPNSTTPRTVKGSSATGEASTLPSHPLAAPVPAVADSSSAKSGTNLHLASLPPPPHVSALSTPTIATPGAVSLLSSHLTSAAGAATSPPPAGGDSQLARPPMEFNHAINYVNKIKNRFVRDPDTYKAFLEILQTYQKEGRAIQDVYAQVTTLFSAAPDLLDEFKQFLPDTSGDTAPFPPGQSSSANASNLVPGKAPSKRPASGSRREDPASAKKSKVGKGKVDDKSKGKQSYKADARDYRHDGEALVDGEVYSHQPHLSGYAAGYAAPSYPTHSGTQPQYAYEAPPHPPPPRPLVPFKPQANQADLAFFSRIKTYVGDAATYHEFLKLLNLYTQDILDLTSLVSRAFLFIGQEAGLWREFRDIVGWSEGRALGDEAGRVEIVDGVRVMENVPSLDGPRRGKGDAGQGWKTYGPSYRQLPQSEISLNCSGRDALCWDVLNDEWVSQPSWASDEGFVAHRKNPYEEALHRSEEERHEYDYHIEANLRTIGLLEPIATRIALMEADERATFCLKPGLGNQSKSIYQRVIKKIYGREQGVEVIQALHENPCVAIPIVLARLKQKDDEWKRALREWNRVWREVDVKNFWRSLDHQAISLKASDKRTHTAKALVVEIETIKREQSARNFVANGTARLPHYQLQYQLSDRDALSDAIKLVFCFLDRTPTISFTEKDKLDAYLRRFLPLIFAFTESEFSNILRSGAGSPGDEDMDSMDETSEAGTSGVEDSGDWAPAGPKRGGKRGHVGDLRKRALKNAVAPSDRATRKVDGGLKSKISSTSAPSSRAGSPAPSLGGTDVDVSSVRADETNTPGSASPLPVASGSAPVETVAPFVNVEMADSAAPNGETNFDAVASTSEIPAAATASTHLDSPMVIDSVEPSPVAANTPEPVVVEVPLPDLIIPVDDRPIKVDVRRQWNSFVNSNLYSLLRLLQIVYHRLTLLKSSAVTLANPPAHQPITPKHVPSLSLFSTIMPTSTVPPIHFYHRALGLCERLYDGDIDQSAFEEGLRQMFGTQAYILFTLDKVIHAILKQSQASMTDSRSQDLVDLLEQDRAHPDRSTAQQQLFYRTQAESAIGNDENLYRFEWVPELHSLSIQLLGKDSIATEDLSTLEKEWAKYMEKYVLEGQTSGAPGINSLPFLKRNMKRVAPKGTEKFPKSVKVQSRLHCKICIRSYRIFYVPHTEDFISRAPSPKSARNNPLAAAAAAIESRKLATFGKWVEGRIKTLSLTPAVEEGGDAVMAEANVVPVPVQAGPSVATATETVV